MSKPTVDVLFFLREVFQQLICVLLVFFSISGVSSRDAEGNHVNITLHKNFFFAIPCLNIFIGICCSLSFVRYLYSLVVFDLITIALLYYMYWSSGIS